MTNGITAPGNAALREARAESNGSKPTQPARIAALRGSDLADLLDPGIKDGPSGSVTHGSETNALAAWIAHQALSDSAKALLADLTGTGTPREATQPADTPIEKNKSDEASKSDPPLAEAAVVLVTEDANLLAGDLLSQQVAGTLRTHIKSLKGIFDDIQDAESALKVDRSKTQNGSVIGDAVAGVGSNNRFASSESEPSSDGPAADGAQKAGDETASKSPMALALDLLHVAAIDYNITATNITAEQGLYARLVAGELGKGKRRVILDGFSLANPDGPILGSVAILQDQLDATKRATASLTRALSPEIAWLDLVNAAAEREHEDWIKSLAANNARAAKRHEERLEELRTDIRELTKKITPGQAVIAEAKSRVTTAESDLTLLQKPDSTGTSPLLRACSREGLGAPIGDESSARQTRPDMSGDPHAPTQPSSSAVHPVARQSGAEPISYVLLVRTSQVGADTVTRRSLLGSSGRIRHIGATSTTWTLLDCTTGLIKDGASHAKANVLTYDLDSNQSKTVSLPMATLSDKDPYRKFENRARWAILILAGAIAVLSITLAVATVLAIVWPSR